MWSARMHIHIFSFLHVKKINFVIWCILYNHLLWKSYPGQKCWCRSVYIRSQCIHMLLIMSSMLKTTMTIQKVGSGEQLSLTRRFKVVPNLQMMAHDTNDITKCLVHTEMCKKKNSLCPHKWTTRTRTINDPFMSICLTSY